MKPAAGTRGLHTYVASVGAAAVLAFVADLILGSGMPVGTATGPALAGVALILGITESRLLSIKVGGTLWAVTFAEVAILTGLLVLPSAWVAVGAAAGILGSGLACHRPAIKTFFNLSVYVLGIVLVGFIAAEPAHLHLDLGVLDLLRLAAGGLMFGILSASGVTGVIALASSQPIRAVLAKGSFMSVIVCAVNTATTVAIMALGVWSVGTLFVVPPMLALVFLFYRLSISAREETELWQVLERASTAVSGLEEQDVATAVVGSALSLVAAATDAELVVDGSEVGYGPRVWRVERNGPVSHGIGIEAVSSDVPTPIDGHPSLVSVSCQDVTSTALVVGLLGSKGVVGRLVLTLDPAVGVGARERKILGTFGRTAADALERSWLYEQARTLGAIKAFEADHDPLTGLANRTLVRRQLSAELADGDGRATALLLLDLDYFKSVNDTLGHTVGDRVLVEVARRLSATVGRDGVVGRLGGDEFVVLMPDVAGPGVAVQTADQLLIALTEPIDIDGFRLSVGASIGVACHPSDAGTVEELFQHADVAMYQAKVDRNSVRRYSAADDDSSVSQLELVAELQAGLDRGELVLHYQPQVEASTGRILGVEALVRWDHPRLGFLKPDSFIPAIERSGLLDVFTARILDQAVSDCASWDRLGIDLTVSVNLSARNLLDSTLPAYVATLLARHQLPAHCLVLEITETTMVSEQAVVKEAFTEFGRIGVQLSVDDFGTGYSSLAFLQRVDADELKIDKSFILTMLTCDNDASIVRATIELAHALGMRTVAEGVETQAHVEALQALGCDVLQGWHTGKPADVVVTTRRLRGFPDAPVPAQRRTDSGFEKLVPASVSCTAAPDRDAFSLVG